MMRVLTFAAALAIASFALPVGPAGAATTLCGSQTASVSGGAYTVQNDEWNSAASECISTSGGTDFSVVNSAMNNPTGNAPGGYPSIYKGCHWGSCTSGSGLPIQVSALSAGRVTTSWNTTRPGGSNVYDASYDIWYNQTSTTSGQPNGAELMIWLGHNGNVGPAGSMVGTATIGGLQYDIYYARQASWNLISYEITSSTASVSNLDVHGVTADAVGRGYIQNSWYLIDVEAGFELWQGGTGLATNSFSVSVG
jgi:cellulose 1,4-beta-cellobiosidase